MLATHLKGGRNLKHPQKIHAAEAQELIDITRHHADPEEELFLCGDLNIANDEPAFKILEEEFVDSTQDLGIAPVPTYRETQRPIDHIMRRRRPGDPSQLRATWESVWGGKTALPFEQDHCGISATYEVEERPSAQPVAQN